jgi:hypothetical protein
MKWLDPQPHGSNHVPIRTPNPNPIAPAMTKPGGGGPKTM